MAAQLARLVESRLIFALTLAMKRVLVVDDEPTIRELITDALRDAGFAVDAAANGAEALRTMEGNRPSAIVLDLMMPQLDAQGFVELMRLNTTFDGIPILVVTAAYAAKDAAERLGAQACLTKPFELDELVALVTQLTGDPLQVPPLDASQPTTSGPGLQQHFAAEP
jgi:DNA-binding response OmpR family regulator